MTMTRRGLGGPRTPRRGPGLGALRRTALSVGCLGAVALLAAACSSSTTSSSSAAAASNSTGSTGSSAVVKVMTVPTYGAILTDGTGKPLYVVSGSCTGGCTSVWPPLTVPAGTTPTGGTGVTGTLGTVTQADGTHQVTYNGRPLYLFNNDAYIAGVTGTKSINGAGAPTPWGVFNTIPPLP